MAMPAEHTHTGQHYAWLNTFNCTEDPFGLYEAGAEPSPKVASYIFVERPYVDVIFGTPAAPQPAFLFAERGAGKTATLRMIARQCESDQAGTLMVRYDDFDFLLAEAHGDPAQITARAHVRAIIRALTHTLYDAVPPGDWQALDAADRHLMMRYVQDLGHPFVRLSLASLIASDPSPIDWDALTPGDILDGLARILIRLCPPRYHAIYILVDNVDESPAGAEAASALLRPLVRDQRLLNTPHVAFKFFLPLELMGMPELRLDRYPYRVIAWNEDALREMVDRRLLVYSDRRIAHFSELCHWSATQSALPRLIDAARRSPRLLIRLCGEATSQAAAAGHPSIRPDDVDRAITEVWAALDRERAAPAAAPPPAPPPPPNLPELRRQLMRLDDVEINALCLDYFPTVYDKFGRDLRKDEKINLLLDHCRRNPEKLVLLAQQLASKLS